MMDFSLFYFAADRPDDEEGYQLLLEGARFADTHGFSAVWTPERHFHAFGGQYPNPAVTGAALATMTERIQIRAGSVVAPLHHPVRIAEEWAMVDRLSGGRAGVSFASGWNAVDFVLRPENYETRKAVLSQSVETVRRLWRLEEVPFPGADGQEVPVRIYPAPVQAELPMWLTSAGHPDTFREAGRLGMGVLTHLLGQDLDVLAGKIQAYREAYAASGAPGEGRVALMIHTFVGEDRDAVRDLVRAPFSAYLRSSIGLLVQAARHIMPGVDIDKLSKDDLDFVISRSFNRFFDTGGLFGTVEDCLKTVAELEAVGVDDAACLIDFGVATPEVLAGLERLDEVRRRHAGI
jgi:natural product biosynthesis luciferase-like monooxygenase protein